MLSLLIIPALILAFAGGFTNLIVSNTSITPVGAIQNVTPLDWIYISIIMAYIIGGISILVYKIRASSGYSKLQICYIITAFVMPAILIASSLIVQRIINLIYPHSLIAIRLVATTSLYSFLLLSLFTAYITFRKHLPSLRYQVSRILTLFIFAFGLFLFLQLTHADEWLRYERITLLTAPDLFLMLILFMIGLGLLSHAKEKLQRLLDRHLLYPHFNPHRVLHEFNLQTNPILDTDLFTRRLFSFLAKNFQPSAIGIMVCTSNPLEDCHLHWHGFTPLQEKVIDQEDQLNLLLWLSRKAKSLMPHELNQGQPQQSQIYTLFEKMKIELFLSLSQHPQIQGFLLLALKKDSHAYTEDEVVVLEKITHCLALAYQRLFLIRAKGLNL